MSGAPISLPWQSPLNVGVVVPGAQLFVYEATTSTKRPVYTTSDLSVQHMNPIEADGNGRFPAMWLDPADGVSYKIVLTLADDSDPPAAAFLTEDNIPVVGADWGVLFESLYGSRADWDSAAQNATLHGVAARSFEVGVHSTGLSAFYAEEAVTEHGRYAFLDNSSVNYSAPASGRAGFNCNATLQGSTNSAHHNSFQSYPHYANSGTIDRLNGFYSIGDITAGVVTAYSHVRIDDPTGAGTITTQYGVYVAALARGGTNYAFYADGAAISHLGYKITLGAIATPATIEYVSVSGNLDITPRAGFKIRSVGPHEFVTAPPVLPSYTVGTLPSAATYARGLIYVSDGTSNKRLAVSDGTNWRWPDGAVVS